MRRGPTRRQDIITEIDKVISDSDSRLSRMDSVQIIVLGCYMGRPETYKQSKKNGKRIVP